MTDAKDIGKEREYQSVVLTFDNGKTATFAGPVCARPGSTRRVTDIIFTEPRPLPNDTCFGLLESNEEGKCAQKQNAQ